MRNIKTFPCIRPIALKIRHLLNKFSYVSGRNNKIRNRGVKISTKIHIRGNGNSLVIQKGAYMADSYVHIAGSNNLVEVGEGAYLEKVQLWVEDNNCKIIIGEDSFIGNDTHLACTENGSELVIGNRCMISSFVQIRTGDSHSILDADGNRINSAESVHIANHVWIGEGAKVLKGVSIGADSVVATGAIVTGNFSENVLIGGVPGKVLKENINWDARRF